MKLPLDIFLTWVGHEICHSQHFSLVGSSTALSKQILGHVFVKLGCVAIRGYLFGTRTSISCSNLLLGTGGLAEQSRILAGQLVGWEEVVGGHVCIDSTTGLGTTNYGLWIIALRHTTELEEIIDLLSVLLVVLVGCALLGKLSVSNFAIS